MRQALLLARQASDSDEVPVGALAVLGGDIIGSGSNRCVMDHDPSAHAEIVAMREAAGHTRNFRLDGLTLYVTLEPCLMCCGALLQARVSRLVFAAREPRTGGVVSVHDALRLQGVQPHVAVTEGILVDEAVSLMHDYFAQRR